MTGPGIGLGARFEKEYGWLVPGTETRMNFFIGFVLKKESWFGEGNQEPTSIPNNTYSHTVKYADYYLRAEFIEVILGDHYKGNHWLDAQLTYEFVMRTFAFPFAVGKKSNMYQSDKILGDELHHKHRFTLSLEFEYSNDTIEQFIRTLGFYISGATFLEIGGELDKKIWAYLGFKTLAQGWIPIIGKYLFIHLVYINNSCIESFSKTQLPFYAFPNISNGAWRPIRGFKTAYRGLTSNTMSIELKTRPFELDREIFQRVKHLDKFMSFFSLGVGLFADIGFIGHPVDYTARLNIKNIFKYSLGSYLETKVRLMFDAMTLTFHFGAVLYHNDTKDGSGTFSPKFYFSIGK